MCSTYTVNETDGVIGIPVTRSNSSSGSVSVLCQTSDDTAEAGSDYTAVNNQQLGWADGDNSTQYCNVTLLSDEIAEQDQTFTVTLNSPTTGAIIGDISTTDITITESSETIESDLNGDNKADIILHSSSLNRLFGFEMDGANIIDSKGIANIPG